MTVKELVDLLQGVENLDRRIVVMDPYHDEPECFDLDSDEPVATHLPGLVVLQLGDRTEA
jgi:hypothetical protein